MTPGLSNNSKSIWNSKTLWINGIVLILAIVTPGLSQEARSATFALAASNILLRFKTNQKVSI